VKELLKAKLTVVVEAGGKCVDTICDTVKVSATVVCDTVKGFVCLVCDTVKSLA